MCKNAGIWSEVVREDRNILETDAREIAKRGDRNSIIKLCNWALKFPTFVNECYVTQATTRIMNEINREKALASKEKQFICHVTSEYPEKSFVMKIE